jgi:hypothetical protein
MTGRTGQFVAVEQYLPTAHVAGAERTDQFFSRALLVALDIQPGVQFSASVFTDGPNFVSRSRSAFGPPPGCRASQRRSRRPTSSSPDCLNASSSG